jgi:hypothetical protein
MSGISMKISWLNLFFELVRKPRFGAEQLLQLRLNNFQLLQLSILAICLISIFLFLVVSTFDVILPNSLDLQSNQMDIFNALRSIKPINLVISGVISFIARGVALTYFGQIFKGQGGFRESILMLAWFDIIHSIGLAIIFIGLWISPTITIMFTLLGTIWLIWIATNFILVLHKFSNIMFVFLGMIFGYFSLHFLLNLVF